MQFTKVRYLAFAYLARFLAKVFFVELPPSLSVGALIRNEAGELLCIELTYLDGLGIPGGLLVGNESPEAALARELHEELGATIKSATLLGATSAPFRSIPSLSLIYNVTIEGDLRDSIEGSAIWVTPQDAARRLAYPNAQAAVKRFIL